MPPNVAMETAICTSVTVSMLAETTGIFNSISLVRKVEVSTSLRDLKEERLGTKRTSS